MEVIEVGQEPFRLDRYVDPLESKYLGYLLTGFKQDIKAGRLVAKRPLVTLDSGWNAVAVAARVKDKALAKRFYPFVVPVTARPYPSVPLGFALFSTAWLSGALKKEPGEVLDSLGWAAKLRRLITSKQLVFCDSMLELSLHGQSQDEYKICGFRRCRAFESMRSVEVFMPGFSC